MTMSNGATTMKQPKIELRKARELKSLSEETPAYTAQLWVDGVHFADVSNHGQGGCDDVHPPRGPSNDPKFHERLMALEKLVKETYPATDISDMLGKPKGTEMIEASLEIVCHQLLGEASLVATVKRDLSRKIMFLKADGKVYEVKKPKGQEAQMIALLKQKHIGCRILNEMTFDEAFRLITAN